MDNIRSHTCDAAHCPKYAVASVLIVASMHQLYFCNHHLRVSFNTDTQHNFAYEVHYCSSAMSTAPPHSPPTAIPWKTRNSTSRMGAHTPMIA